MVLPKFLSKSSRKHRSSNSTSNPTSPSPSAGFASPTGPLDTHNHPSIPLRRDSEPRSPASSPEKRARASADIPSGSRSGSAKRPPVSPVKAASSSARNNAGSSRRASPAPTFPDPFDSLDRDYDRYDRSPDPDALNHNGIGLHAAASHLSAQQRRRQSAQPVMETAGVPQQQQQQQPQEAASPRAFAAPSRPFVKPEAASGEASEPMSPVDMQSPDVRPPVPPHRTPPGPSAEECKTAGNRFFKSGEFDKAVAEYSKGMSLTLV
jgi:hypothetical protein